MELAGPIILLCLSFLAIAFRRVPGPRYWMITLGALGVSVGIPLWLSRGTPSPVTPVHQATAVIFLVVVPMLLGFATAKARALRERPWLSIVIVPLVFVAAVYLDMIVGASLDILQP
jgi:hypothetical protein